MTELSFYVPPLDPNVDGMLSALSERGIRWIGTDGVSWGALATRPHEVDRLVELLDRYGLRMSSHHYAGPNIAPIGEDQERVIRSLELAIESAARWKPRALVVHWGGYPDTPGDPQEWLKYTVQMLEREAARHGLEALARVQAENLRAVAPLAARHSMSLAVENLLGPWPNGTDPSHILRLVELADQPNMGVCLDAGHAHCSGFDVAETVRLYGSKLMETHFHDNVGVPPDPWAGNHGDQHLPVGLGTINWLDVVRALEETHFPGPVTFEGCYVGRTLEGFVRGVDVTIANWRAIEDVAEAEGKG